MPNYCANILTVSGPVKDVDRFIVRNDADGVYTDREES
jgi:hypothetical protein